MGTIRTSIYCFIDYSATLHDSFEVGYSIIKNGGKGRDYLPNTGTLDKSFFDEISYESFISLYEKLFDRSSYNNLPIPRFGAKEVLVNVMGIWKNNEDFHYKKGICEDCSFAHSKIPKPPINVFIKEVTCTKMISTPIWKYVDSSLIYSASSHIGIFRMAINRENTPTMCLLIVSEEYKEKP